MPDMRDLFVLANAFKEGDLPLGGTRDETVRAEARRALLATRVGAIRRAAFVDDGVTAALEHSRDRSHDAELDGLTIRELSNRLLAPAGPAWVRERRHALASEVAAACVKVLGDAELAAIARSIAHPLPGEGLTVGAAGHFGSRIQPNSPGDDEDEIVFSVLEGLAHGCGDVVIGLNPAADELGTIVRLERLLEQIVTRLDLPTRYCVLSDLRKQHAARGSTRVDVGFQSIAGTSAGLLGMIGLDVDGILDLARDFDGLYFETGQGSAVTNGAAEGVDMVTLEARAYGVARHIQRQTQAWTIVNDVAGFIGPEVFRTPAQLERACLEDLVMARLHGLTMGLDICATFHMGITPADLRAVTERIVRSAAPAYLMAVAGNADPMLGYLTTSFRDHARLRHLAGRQPASAMQRRLDALGTSTASLYAAYARAGGDRRASAVLEDEGRVRLGRLRERGFDLGEDETASEARLDAIYQHARRALYARLDDGLIDAVCPGALRVRTAAIDRDDYLMHPAQGEQLRAEDARALLARAAKRPQVQLVIADGLNAIAVNEQLRTLIPALRRGLAGLDVAPSDIVVDRGRVRVGYEIGGLVDAEVVIHLIGERPGTGLNTVSAYLTYGRDEHGASRWRRELDHACTTAVCGIHPSGKPAAAAAAEISRTVGRIIAQRRSGVSLQG